MSVFIIIIIIIIILCMYLQHEFSLFWLII